MKWLPFLAKAMGKSVWLPAEGAGRAILLTSDVVGPMAGSYAPWYEQSMNPRPWRDSPKSQQVSGQIGQGDVDLPARENKALLDYHTRLGGEHGVRYRRFRLWTLNSLRKSLMPERRKRK